MKYYVQLEDGRQFVVRFVEEAGRLKAYLREGEDGPERVLEIDPCFLEGGRGLHLLVGGRSHDLLLEPGRNGSLSVLSGGRWHAVEVVDDRERIARAIAGQRSRSEAEIKASMPGVVVSVAVEEGAEVKTGDTLLVIEAMKMQNPIQSPADGVVRRVHVRPGETVAAGAPLVSVG